MPTRIEGSDSPYPLMSYLVTTYHDTCDTFFDHFVKITPLIKNNFEKAFVSVTPKALETSPKSISFLKNDSFYVLLLNEKDSLIGDHFNNSFKLALKSTKPDDHLHLCTLDRLAFALQDNFKDVFLEDVKEAQKKKYVTLFERSEYAWKTHPKNYQAIESMCSELGKVLFGVSLDYAWCHITLRSADLNAIIDKLDSRSLIIFAQLVYELKDKIKTKKVDWLSWEDPYIFGKNHKEYKLERELSLDENRKRLDYILPMIDYLLNKYQENLRLSTRS